MKLMSSIMSLTNSFAFQLSNHNFLKKIVSTVRWLLLNDVHLVQGHQYGEILVNKTGPMVKS